MAANVSVPYEEVWIKFPVTYDDEDGAGHGFKFYKGLITKVQTYLPEDDPANSEEIHHYVKFGDHDDGYYNLGDLEATGSLKWSQEEADKALMEESKRLAPKKAAQKKAAPAPPSAGVGATAPSVVMGRSDTGAPMAAAPTASTSMVTPPKGKRPHENTQQNGRKVKVKLEFGSTSPKSHDDTSNQIDVEEFEDWLRNVHEGARGGNISETNAKSVMKRVKELVDKEQGVTYINWPSDIVFHHGETVTLDTDFDALLKKAKRFEKTHGKDKGNGWKLTHPIKKLWLYKQYVEEKQGERANPDTVFE